MLVSISIICLLALLVNLPLGIWRQNTRKFSLWWFVAVHASIPLIIYMRQQFDVSMAWVPLTIGFAILGQTFGAQFSRKRVVIGRWS
ncbi:hypothetical protein [Tumebacillus permanentifrigoris]|uniref:Uncharacterized protein n=1 Tax=Tumebacillus permanentifrigoris TaxID=378543 RepID=A0A316D9N3_9BACL|nr:hypothetical protein [Tumebacillus permanentifrigoris]PWK13895.1 hypothetical protein C7459_106175 [Tumebacillus permanentifrigoris]